MNTSCCSMGEVLAISACAETINIPEKWEQPKIFDRRDYGEWANYSDLVRTVLQDVPEAMPLVEQAWYLNTLRGLGVTPAAQKLLTAEEADALAHSVLLACDDIEDLVSQYHWLDDGPREKVVRKLDTIADSRILLEDRVLIPRDMLAHLLERIHEIKELAGKWFEKCGFFYYELLREGRLREVYRFKLKRYGERNRWWYTV